MEPVKESKIKLSKRRLLPLEYSNEPDLWEAITVVEQAFHTSPELVGGLDNVEVATEIIWENVEHIVADQGRLTFACIFGIIITYTFWKGRSYGDSWCKHGEAVSIFGNVSRKYDRLEKIIVHGASEIGEVKSTTIADLLVYSSLWLTWLAENDPVNMLKFIKFAKSELIHEDKSETCTKEEKTITSKEKPIYIEDWEETDTPEEDTEDPDFDGGGCG
jgi:hypothetical protein